MPTPEFESNWTILRDELAAIHKREAGQLSFEGRYRLSYRIVFHRQGPLLYQKVKEFEQERCSHEVKPRIQKAVPKDLERLALPRLLVTSANERRRLGEGFLRLVLYNWTEYSAAMNMIADVLM